MLDEHQIEAANEEQRHHPREFQAAAEQLDRRGQEVERMIERIASFEVAVPSWALGTGGTRFGRFPGPGEPRNVYEKMDDVAVIQQLTRATPRVSLHIPWDEPDDVGALKAHADELNLSFDAVNSNTFQDQPGQAHSYKFGSFSHTDPAVRQQAVEHNLHVVELGGVERNGVAARRLREVLKVCLRARAENEPGAVVGETASDFGADAAGCAEKSVDGSAVGVCHRKQSRDGLQGTRKQRSAVGACGQPTYLLTSVPTQDSSILRRLSGNWRFVTPRVGTTRLARP